MQLIVDGEIFQLQRFGGILALERAVLPLLCDAAADLQVTLLTTGRLRAPIPQHAQIRHRALLPVDDLLRPRRVWAPLQARLRRALIGRAGGSGADAIWMATFYAPPPPGWAGRSLVRLHDLIHEQFPQQFRGAYNRQLRADKRRSLLTADRVVAVSAATAAAALASFPLDPARLRVVPNALDAEFLMPAPCAAAQRPLLLYVGQRTAHKNFTLLLQAFAAWPGRHQTALLVVGPPWSRAELRQIAALGLDDGQLLLRSGVPTAELRCLYRQAAALLLPSLAEGFGIPVLEALAGNALLVASDIPSTRELAGELPYYFDPRDPAALQAALDRALSDPAAPTRRAAGSAVAARYSWQRSAAGLLAVLRELDN
jgi:glycosyltransferase involved in cell wall biosynthesis